MEYLFKTLFFIGLIAMSACSADFEKLSKINQEPSEEFSKYLFNEYKLKAEFEAKEMHDWNSAKLYSQKALKALQNKNLMPEKLNYWKIPKNKIIEIQKAHENLMIVYQEAIKLDPYNLAVAISSLDCWSEQQEENWQTWDIKECREDFLNALHQIYNKFEKSNKIIEKDKSKSEENVTVVTKDKNEKLLQIIYFDFDKSLLTDVSINKLKKFINENNKIIKKYLIVGHTDTKGSHEYNMKLSLDRAEAVKKILLELDINHKNITILGKGENNLLVKTPDDIAHPANRRAEIGELK
tara:strand:- start:156 stop:1043 length:888 start_codon:yes stop_codon:yes gene_type:complete